jgi:hypothetical protein
MVNAVLPRITVAPKGSFFLFGARGVGKSTWARETLAGAHRFDLLDEGLFQSFLADPALFGARTRFAWHLPPGLSCESLGSSPGRGTNAEKL